VDRDDPDRDDWIMAYQVRRTTADEWRRLREIRLEALKDTPIGFGERYDTAIARPDSYWRERAERDASSHSTAKFVAVNEADGALVGTIGVFPASRQRTGESSRPDGRVDEHEYVLYAVYVSPAHRGAFLGVATLLFDHAVAWARDTAGAQSITLSVHERNHRAHAFYRRYGFVETGVTMPYALDPSAKQIWMRLERDTAPDQQA
jgi:ribosomal protein S18 acetylase RimI-like enzyme